MRHIVNLALATSVAFGIAACQPSGDQEVDKALNELNVIDESGLNDVMMQAADPDEAVSYFQRAAANDPGRIDLQRGLAESLTRANRSTEAVASWKIVVGMPGSTPDDQVGLAESLVRNNQWDEAEQVLNTIPPTHETFERYKIEAVVADANEDWAKADSFYETAAGLTTTPAGVLNNWGYSKLTRGDYDGAERLFTDALRYEPTMFTAKNNLVLARGAQRNYDLPVIAMTQQERAQLLYTLALTAIKQNDISMGRALLVDAIETNPQHFEEASRALAALDETGGAT